MRKMIVSILESHSGYPTIASSQLEEKGWLRYFVTVLYVFIYHIFMVILSSLIAATMLTVSAFIAYVLYAEAFVPLSIVPDLSLFLWLVLLISYIMSLYRVISGKVRIAIDNNAYVLEWLLSFIIIDLTYISFILLMY